MKKWILSITAAATIVGLAACSGNNDDKSNVVVETSAGNITEDELFQKLKDQYGEMVLYEMVLTKVLEDKYPVSDKEVDAELAKLKEQYGAQFQMFLASNGVQDENAFKDTLRLQLIQDKALSTYIDIPENELKKKYDEMKPELKASHILIKDEKTAKDVLQKVKAGEDFAKLAEEYSEDPGSAANGGDLGYFGTGVMTKPFEEAAYALKVGEISDLVKSEFGYHIIKLTDIKEVKPFDEMKDEIRKQLIQEKAQQDPTGVQEKIKKELQNAKIDVKDKDLKGIFDFINEKAPSDEKTEKAEAK
ncbi:parvulin-like peptidyl-prolyl isomerase [Schinkia azotoformans MEV2011]|uniref:Foldase protein PrsA n=1 Tax=Schinkia azotoformans MEV2011 TaxID=1348973 RepID=A0A072NG91_SCHAZ|nr:peptidylprolyl isomerase [Schinkia azotoformans]KEF36704.1 parvulin-like peptidyl-prolyl isomerase [Schinkia azotoformans MEV2011]MEC1695411.1 peptidylprolyl isomerase [Schinkia azotoformans]MEC1724401.1 peptidylprolyl isomerase [Schinkia azotoformans]MEC1773220.1 peptidylprolyl isomerase [Schinkia azotoformans]MED4365969.1 peptidylprolyl isomerase [Schinkia azotoformans]